ncbi:FimD/PapC C-terminal domain-containing protein, partial [Enterobacter hormaechei]|uniref:FimD/PapC C-terminal domain-containing protein n=1 Tax=Enterobacter hormaechei TaxID=158836 RepID=UPI0030763DFA
VLDIYSSLSLIWRYSYCPVFQGATSVGQAGQAYVRGVEDKGALRVVWGSDGSSSCTVHYQIPENAKKAGLTTILSNQQCQM